MYPRQKEFETNLILYYNKIMLGEKKESTQYASIRKAFGLSALSAFIAGLCCFSPVVIVFLGLGSTAFAGSLADTLYGDYKWYFRSTGVIFLSLSFYWWYVQKSKSCALDQRKKLQKQILNIFLVSLSTSIFFYLIWLYIVVDYLGFLLNIWGK